MAKKQKPEESNSTPKNTYISVGGNVDGNIIVGDNNIIHYYATVEKNTEKHEPDHWELKHPYPMPPNFTGRIAERAMLTHWLEEDSENRLFILRALGGFGKSALSWQWLTHDVKPEDFPKVLWWSFYEGDASFEHFIEETLKYLKLEVPQGGRPQVDALFKAMGSQKILLIMDGFERALRAYSSMNAAYQGDESPLPEGEGKGEGAYDCVNLNAEIFLKSVCSLPNIKSKVLMTTRLTPCAVKPHGEFMLGCREVELTSMGPADAVEFFHNQGIKGTHAEIEAACAPYGYQPLSLRLLAGRILKDFENPADIVVAQKLKIDGDIVQQKHHVLEVSYNSLPQHEGKLLSTIACFRSPVELKTLEAIEEGNKSLQDVLQDLVARGLLHFDKVNKKFDLHPIVRRYAYERLTVQDRTAIHTRLIDYFEAVPKPEKVEKLEEITPLIELYHHMVRAEKLNEAIILFHDRLANTLYFQLGKYQIVIELLLALFLDGEDGLPRLEEDAHVAWTLNLLRLAYCSNGQPRRGLKLWEFEKINRLFQGGQKAIAVGLGTVAAYIFLPIGSLKEAKYDLQDSIVLCDKTENKLAAAINHSELGNLLSFCGKWDEAVQQLDISVELIQTEKEIQAESITWSNRALHFLLMARTQIQSDQSPLNNIRLAIESAERALEMADKGARTTSPVPRDYVRDYWLLGSAYRANGELEKAEENLSKAINICRQINNVEAEANILLDLARLRYDQKDYEEAKSLVDEALLITERCGYVLQGADVNLFLAQYALEQEKDKAKAKAYAEEALKLATCDGPPYYYKVAYEEAERFLKDLGG